MTATISENGRLCHCLFHFRVVCCNAYVTPQCWSSPIPVRVLPIRALNGQVPKTTAHLTQESNNLFVRRICDKVRGSFCLGSMPVVLPSTNGYSYPPPLFFKPRRVGEGVSDVPTDRPLGECRIICRQEVGGDGDCLFVVDLDVVVLSALTVRQVAVYRPHLR